MIHEEGSLTLKEGAASGARLYTQSWSPEAVPKAVIVLVHGYDEHSGRYRYFAEHCTKAGFSVYALDHWGHGQSDGDNGFVPKFSVYHDGVTALLNVVKTDHPDLPVILVGHSLGGLIGTSYLLDHQSQFAAAVLSGPAIKAVDEPSAFLRFISAILSKIAPKMGVLSLDPQGVSRDPDVVAAYLADPLVSGKKVGARLGREMMVTMDMVGKNTARINLPVLLLHGAEDRLTAPEGSVFLHENVSSTHKQVIIYPELFHEIFNEPEKDSVLRDMTDWIDKILGQ